jgi:hypothetical protein
MPGMGAGLSIDMKTEEGFRLGSAILKPSHSNN